MFEDPKPARDQAVSRRFQELRVVVARRPSTNAAVSGTSLRVPPDQLKLDQEHAGELGAPAIAADLVTAAKLDHEHAGELGAPAIAAELVTIAADLVTAMESGGFRDVGDQSSPLWRRTSCEIFRSVGKQASQV